MPVWLPLTYMDVHCRVDVVSEFRLVRVCKLEGEIGNSTCQYFPFVEREYKQHVRIISEPSNTESCQGTVVGAVPERKHQLDLMPQQNHPNDIFSGSASHHDPCWFQTLSLIKDKLQVVRRILPPTTCLFGPRRELVGSKHSGVDTHGLTHAFVTLIRKVSSARPTVQTYRKVELEKVVCRSLMLCPGLFYRPAKVKFLNLIRCLSICHSLLRPRHPRDSFKVSAECWLLARLGAG